MGNSMVFFGAIEVDIDAELAALGQCCGHDVADGVVLRPRRGPSGITMYSDRPVSSCEYWLCI
ncbi:hypothetical protein OHA40_13415 [Nocardia sp. NBC_00508]|uniref:hypothetical protein n=1 Tax=Nocardia sp. NBC_00508 TaxID=2975992 RepID=UPI002E8166BB|nr:hypothetical protein [Nocardia sp. NBC_00508]WUD69027.1 hypothetical protein OHA40_13415 [Nocardia sp. NBC_00508]